jgi:hypothetical protein
VPDGAAFGLGRVEADRFLPPGNVPARAVSVPRTANYACGTAELLHNVTGRREGRWDRRVTTRLTFPSPRAS